MNTSRIESVIDTAMLGEKNVLLVGAGAAAGIARDLVRCGVGGIDLIDPDIVSEENICRQDYYPDQIGMPKVEALKKELNRIDPDIPIRAFHEDICDASDQEASERFDYNVLIAATDSHRAQARVNQIALMQTRPAVFAGLYRGGRAGDIAFYTPELPSCYRCLFPSRYVAAERGSVDPPSDGATLPDVRIFDGIATHLCLGLLTYGANNRFGKLIGALGDRQVLQIKIDPDWKIGDSDPVRKYLEIPETNDGFFSYCTVARRDPDPSGQCPDCKKYRYQSISFGVGGVTVRGGPPCTD